MTDVNSEEVLPWARTWNFEDVLARFFNPPNPRPAMDGRAGLLPAHYVVCTGIRPSWRVESHSDSPGLSEHRFRRRSGDPAFIREAGMHGPKRRLWGLVIAAGEGGCPLGPDTGAGGNRDK